MANLTDVLALERIETNRFRGRAYPNGRSRVFGGVVLGQALQAASQTVERHVHSLHAYFLLPGDPTRPILYTVERTRDGGSYSLRHCQASQGDRVIFEMSASFAVPEFGISHQAAMPVVPDPDSIADIRTPEGSSYLPSGMLQWFEDETAVDIRPCDSTRYTDPAPRSRQRVWFRASAPLPDDDKLHCSALAYASDLTIIDAVFAAHGRSLFEPEFVAASIDHALWFHRPFRMDDWLLYDQDSPTSSGARGLARGLVFNRRGELVASVVQEGLIRRDQRFRS